MNKGERAITIDEVSLEWCFQPGVKLDFRHFDDGYVATAADVEAELKRIGHTLSPLEIVVVNTAAGKRYGRDDYVPAGCGMGYEATMYLLKRGVRLTGTDGWSWDATRGSTANWFYDRLFSHEDSQSVRGMDPRRRHSRFPRCALTRLTIEVGDSSHAFALSSTATGRPL
jgi:kynurenine formamidase